LPYQKPPYKQFHLRGGVKGRRGRKKWVYKFVKRGEIHKGKTPHCQAQTKLGPTSVQTTKANGYNKQPSYPLYSPSTCTKIILNPNI